MASFVPKGVFTALVTPFTSDTTTVDYAALESHVEAQVAAKISGLVPCGTTGESPTLSANETLEVIRRVVKLCRGRTQVLAGTGSNNTDHSVLMSRAAAEAGADAVMLVTPYYNRPSQEGLFWHFKTIAESVKLPVVLYNIPGRTATRLSIGTTVRLAEACANIVAVKDATNNVLYCQQLRRTIGDRLSVLSGDDALTVPMMSIGARGVISVTSNVLPEAVIGVTNLALAGDYAAAAEAHLRLLPVHEAMFTAPNPVPVKLALEARGVMSAAVRKPLVLANAEEKERILSALRQYEAT